MIRARAAFLAGLMLLTSVAGVIRAQTANRADSAASDLAWHIEALLRSDDPVVDGTEILTHSILLDLYERSGFEPVWTGRARVGELVRLIQDSTNHGLTPADYNIDLLQRTYAEFDIAASPERRALLDVLLSESLLRYGYHRRYGKVEGSRLDPNINYRRETFRIRSPELNLDQAIRVSPLAEFIESIAPAGPVYSQLQRELQSHRVIAAAGGWPTVSGGPTLRRGDESPRVAEVRRRLAASGDLLEASATDSPYFDRDLEDAVGVFQERHALGTGGEVDAQTLAAMNVPVESRVDQLRLSLERLRWVDQEATDTLVAVNIAGFRAFYFEGGEFRWHTRAMVGRDYRQTPVFRGEIAYLEFNPTWTIPPNILRNDTLPAIKRDPTYLTTRNIRVIDGNGRYIDPLTVDWQRYNASVPYTLRQDAGPGNPLGVVKFVFPNRHSVVLHDTPDRNLFAEPERAFSSGCIRIEHPLTLAELVLNDPDNYSAAALEAIVASGETRRVFPARSVPVLIVYLTASIDPKGYVRFYRDIYDRDRRMLDALNGPVSINPADD